MLGAAVHPTLPLALAGTFPAGVYPLVYNQTEPFWLAPWLGAYKGGRVFAADGKTPNLDSTAMVSALQLLQDLKFKYKVFPAESDYGTADTQFKEGKAAMIINGVTIEDAFAELDRQRSIFDLPARAARCGSGGSRWPHPGRA